MNTIEGTGSSLAVKLCKNYFTFDILRIFRSFKFNHTNAQTSVEITFCNVTKNSELPSDNSGRSKVKRTRTKQRQLQILSVLVSRVFHHRSISFTTNQTKRALPLRNVLPSRIYIRRTNFRLLPANNLLLDKVVSPCFGDNDFDTDSNGGVAKRSDISKIETKLPKRVRVTEEFAAELCSR